ncbi:uncharacterized protein LOC142352964 [Convolutriloba macropyga]|uniref:uncharacterized protein LOC142352964 n=1 Tax=Convolutriloba macropyga TaxID=536237 RepID=UPI003F51C057
MPSKMVVEVEEIEKAQKRIKPFIHRTPIETSLTFDSLFAEGRRIFFKCENLQKCGSFKIRGAMNSVLMVKQQKPYVRSVMTRSSGNFGGGLAYAAKLHNLSCYIVSPKRGSELKRQIAESYGATVSLYNSTFAERDALIEQVRNETGAEYIMSSAQESTLCGQGTCGLEILEQVPEVDAVIVPCGGGGLLGGVATAMKVKKPNIKVFGVEHSNALNAKRSFDQKSLFIPEDLPPTICDGLGNTHLSQLTLEHILEYVDDIIPVPDKESIHAVKFLMYRMKMAVEPSGAIAAAVLMNRKNIEKYFYGCNNIVVILSGGNFDYINKAPLLSS